MAKKKMEVYIPEKNEVFHNLWNDTYRIFDGEKWGEELLCYEVKEWLNGSRN